MVVDIDNTIANTEQTYGKGQTTSQRYATVKAFEGMKAKLDSYPENTNFLYLSARNYIHYFTTKRWLKENKFKNASDLCLVLYAEDKLPFLRNLTNYTVEYYDDLSYNHEKGDVKYYDEVISLVRNMNLTYYDFENIKTINNHA